MARSRMMTRLAAGAAAGFVGTLVIRGLMAAGRKALPDASPPMSREPGEFMVEKAEALLPQTLRERIPEKMEKWGAKALGLGYGIAFGAAYALLRDEVPAPAREGAAVGLVAWATGYLGWLPATGIMPPLTRQTPKQVVAPVVIHLLYGIATVAAYRTLAQRAAAVGAPSRHLVSRFFSFEEAPCFEEELLRHGYTRRDGIAEELGGHEYLKLGKESPESWRDGGVTFVWRSPRTAGAGLLH